MVKLRLKRFGRRNRPYYRLNAMDTKTPRDGRSIEELGSYDPLERDQAKAITINKERVQYWLSVGARPSETVRGLLKKIGIASSDNRQKFTSKPKPKKAAEPAKAATAAAPAAPAAEAKP